LLLELQLCERYIDLGLFGGGGRVLGGYAGEQLSQVHECRDLLVSLTGEEFQGLGEGRELCVELQTT